MAASNLGEPWPDAEQAAQSLSTAIWPRRCRLSGSQVESAGQKGMGTDCFEYVHGYRWVISVFIPQKQSLTQANRPPSRIHERDTGTAKSFLGQDKRCVVLSEELRG